MITQPYHPNPVSCEHVTPYISLRTDTVENATYKEYAAFTTVKSTFCQPLHLTLILHLFVIANNIRYLINKL